VRSDYIPFVIFVYFVVDKFYNVLQELKHVLRDSPPRLSKNPDSSRVASQSGL
jgi:hypothetical protein